MTAPELLDGIRARGGVATVERTGAGAAILNVSPRSLALELLPELQRFKPALLELLEPARPISPEAPGALDVATRRAHIARLERRLGQRGAVCAIVRAWRRFDRLERARAKGARRFWALLDASERHALATCAALLDAGESLEL